MHNKFNTGKIFFLGMAMVFLLLNAAYAENIDPNNDGSQWAWGENAGWLNFDPTQGIGVTVDDNNVTGYVWAENIGWINLSPSQYGGVTNDNGNGVLSGWAWSENAGWINFKPADYGGVTIDNNGNFNGWAWGENIGWIHFSSTTPVAYKVQTAWTPAVAASGTVWITTNLARAAFVVTAPSGKTFNGSGFIWTRFRVSLGDYTVTFQPVPGYTTPPPQTQTLDVGETITFKGEYQVASGTVLVTTNLARATFVVTAPGGKILNGSGVVWTSFKVPLGDYTVTYGDISGYTTPPPQTKTLNSGETITFKGTYAAAPTTTTVKPTTTTTTVQATTTTTAKPTTTTTTAKPTTTTTAVKPTTTTTTVKPTTTTTTVKPTTTSTTVKSTTTTTTVQATTSTTPILTTTSTVPATTIASTTSTSMPASTTTTTTAGQRFVDNNNGTVTDTRTGRIWLKKATRVEEGYKNWNAAVAYCSSLASGTAGLIDNSVAGDWRLPTKAELGGLGTDPPATWVSCPSVWTVPGAPFTDVDARYNWFYWSSDGDTSSAWAVSMFDGCVSSSSKTTGYNNVWPVRSGP